MSLSITFTGASDGDDGPFEVASASGWAAFAAWADGLGSRRFGLIRELCDEGEAIDTATLSEQFARALELGPPEDEGVRSVADNLATLIGVGDEDETATLTGGTTDETTDGDDEPSTDE